MLSNVENVLQLTERVHEGFGKIVESAGEENFSLLHAHPFCELWRVATDFLVVVQVHFGNPLDYTKIGLPD